MKPNIFLLVSLFILSACTNTSGLSHKERTGLADLRAEIETVRAAGKITELKLQEEMQRADAQLFLTRQEMLGLRRQLAAMRERCGEICADLQ